MYTLFQGIVRGLVSLRRVNTHGWRIPCFIGALFMCVCADSLCDLRGPGRTRGEAQRCGCRWGSGAPRVDGAAGHHAVHHHHHYQRLQRGPHHQTLIYAHGPTHKHTHTHTHNAQSVPPPGNELHQMHRKTESPNTHLNHIHISRQTVRLTVSTACSRYHRKLLPWTEQKWREVDRHTDTQQRGPDVPCTSRALLALQEILRRKLLNWKRAKWPVDEIGVKLAQLWLPGDSYDAR